MLKWYAAAGIVSLAWAALPRGGATPGGTEAPRPAGWALPGYDDRHPEDLTALLEPIRAEAKLPALAGAIVTSGRLVAVGATGVRKLGDATPVTPGDEFHLGSCTKAMTGALIGLLVEEGKLSWSTKLLDVFPELAGKADPGWREVTVEHVLAHRAGFTGSYPPGVNPWTLPGTAPEQRLASLAGFLAKPPASPPGTKYEYSNAGYSALGCMVDRLMGTPWEDAIRRRLFEPLGMLSAGIGAAGTPGKVDQPWQHRVSSGALVPVEPGPRSDNHDVIGPGGKVHASMADWARFIALNLRGAAGRDGLLKAETVRRLQTMPFGGDYFAGWVATERPWAGGRVLTHNGSNTMNFCVVWVATQRDFAVLAATNAGGDEAPKATDKAAWAMIQRWQREATR